MRKSQVAILTERSNLVSHRVLVAAFRQREPEAVGISGERGLDELVRIAIAVAQAWGAEDDRSLWYYLRVMAMLGAHFDRDPQYPWARRMLEAPPDRDHQATIERLYKTVLAYFEQLAGQGHKKLIIAAERLERFDLVRRSPSQLAVFQREDIASQLALIHPERFSAQGPAAIEVLVADGLATAQHCGLEGPAERLMLVLLRFMLGTYFDEDPQHEWARGRIENIGGQGSEAAASLYDDLIAYLRRRYGSGLRT